MTHLTDTVELPAWLVAGIIIMMLFCMVLLTIAPHYCA